MRRGSQSWGNKNTKSQWDCGAEESWGGETPISRLSAFFVLNQSATSFSTNGRCILTLDLLRGQVPHRSSEQPLRQCHFINAVLVLPILRRCSSCMMHCEKIGTNILEDSFNVSSTSRSHQPRPGMRASRWVQKDPAQEAKVNACFLSFQKRGRCLRLFCMLSTWHQEAKGSQRDPDLPRSP